jgi:peptidoglycan/xylan/chitin deacetylase (PgdA/CDA1 family)
MYKADSYDGHGMSAKTLCLTFDDGPGPETLPIARYLHAQHIPATFFAVGKYAIHQPELLQELRQLGHTVGNHTYEHPDMPYYVSVNGNIQDQIIRTDAVLQLPADEPVLFRAPYGKFSAEVAAELNANLLSALNHIGPIRWEIDGIDCHYWRTGRTVSDAVQEYHTNITRANKGIVVFHDDIADMDVVKPLNKTLALLQQLIPLLQQEQYTFIPLQQVPSVAQAIQNPLLFRLSAGKGKFLSAGTNGLMLSSGQPLAWQASLEGYGKIRLHTVNGAHLYVDNNSHHVSLSDTGEGALLDYIPVTNNRFLLRTYSGNFLAAGKDGSLHAGAAYMRQATIFRYLPENLPARTQIGMAEKIKLARKGLQFIKSKITSR